jgi:hypothetical protein
MPALLACTSLLALFRFTHDWAYTAAMTRKLVWIEKMNFQGFGCSECNWVFKPSDALAGKSLDEMKREFEAQCEKEFAAHVCAGHLRATNTNAK